MSKDYSDFQIYDNLGASLKIDEKTPDDGSRGVGGYFHMEATVFFTGDNVEAAFSLLEAIVHRGREMAVKPTKTPLQKMDDGEPTIPGSAKRKEALGDDDDDYSISH